MKFSISTAMGALKPVDFTDWAAHIVALWQPNRRVRIFAEFSTSLNDVLEFNQYPLLLPEKNSLLEADGISVLQ